MSTEPQSAPTVVVPPRPSDPLAECSDEQVLRCRDPETDWLWFYDVDRDGTAVVYHEFRGWRPQPTARSVVAEIVALESVEVDYVSAVHLEVRRGGSE